MKIQTGDLVQITNTWYYNGLFGVVKRTYKKPKLPMVIVVKLLNPHPDRKTTIHLNIVNIERLA